MVDVQQVKDAEQQANDDKLSSMVTERTTRNYENNLDDLIRKLEENTDKMMEGVQDDLDEICEKLTGKTRDATVTPRRPVGVSIPEFSVGNLAALVHEIPGTEYAPDRPLQIRAEGKILFRFSYLSEKNLAIHSFIQFKNQNSCGI